MPLNAADSSFVTGECSGVVAVQFTSDSGDATLMNAEYYLYSTIIFFLVLVCINRTYVQ